MKAWRPTDAEIAHAMRQYFAENFPRVLAVDAGTKVDPCMFLEFVQHEGSNQVWIQFGEPCREPK